MVAVRVAVAGAGSRVEEEGLLSVDLGARAALAVVRLPAVLVEPARDVDAVALADVLGDRLSLLGPADDRVPFGLLVAVLAAAVGRQPELDDGRAGLGLAQFRVGPDPAQQFDSVDRA